MFDVVAFMEKQLKFLRAEVKGKAIIACSGGVDSTTATVLASQALEDDLLAIYVDTGLMRKGESEQVCGILSRLKVNYKFLDATNEFLEALRGIEDPERKRQIIGNKFVEIFENEAKSFGSEYLIQGTIAPDWIESGGKLRDRIKSHHNVAGLPEVMNLKLVEPLRDLYKDEVRQLARHLGVHVSERQPFPGPALAVRIAGEVIREKVDLIRDITAIVEEEIEKAARESKMVLPWQYFAILLPTKSVGVQGDVRVYGYTVVVRAVDSVDGMTASYSNIPHDVLEIISSRITNEVKGVNRVLYDISHKPPATIEWE